jgi:hypothetical protein
MRKTTLILALSVLAGIAWLGPQLNQPRAAENAKPAIQKWEYKVVTGDIGSDILMRQIGADGDSITRRRFSNAPCNNFGLTHYREFRKLDNHVSTRYPATATPIH